MIRSLISTTAALTFLALALIAAPGNVFAQADKSKATVQTSADTRVESREDNSGKKLAIANFSKQVDESKDTVTKSVESISKSVQNLGKTINNDYMPKVTNKKVTINVPEVEIPSSLQDLCEDCINSGQQMAQFVREHAFEYAAVVAKYIKQFNETTRLTPVSTPYTQQEDGLIPNDFGLKNTTKYFTPEGRLKTVIQR